MARPPRSHADRHAPLGRVRVGRRARRAPIAAAASPSRAGSATITSMRSPPTRLQLRRRALGDHRPPSITAMRSASWSASSRYCVVSSSVVPPSDQLADQRPHVVPAARVEAGRRLVQEQHRRASRPGWPPGRAGAACRPSTSWPAGRRRPSGRSARAARRRARARTAGTGGKAAEHLQVRAPGQQLVDGRVLAREADCATNPRGLSTTSRPATRGRPASGRSSVVRIRITVVFPAPFGPSSPQIVPASTRRSKLRTAWSRRSACPGPRPGRSAPEVPGGAGSRLGWSWVPPFSRSSTLYEFRTAYDNWYAVRRQVDVGG